MDPFLRTAREAAARATCGPPVPGLLEARGTSLRADVGEALKAPCAGPVARGLPRTAIGTPVLVAFGEPR